MFLIAILLYARAPQSCCTTLFAVLRPKRSWTHPIRAFCSGDDPSSGGAPDHPQMRLLCFAIHYLDPNLAIGNRRGCK
jgi:hypothetical protein